MNDRLLQLREGHANSPHAPKDGGDRIEIDRRNVVDDRRILCSDESKGLNCPSARTSMKRSSKLKVVSHSNGVELHKYQKSRIMVSKEQLCPDAEPKTQTAKESGRLIYCSLLPTPFALSIYRGVFDVGITTSKDNFPLQETNRVSNLDLTRIKGTKKTTKGDNHQHLEDGTVKKRKVKVIYQKILSA